MFSLLTNKWESILPIYNPYMLETVIKHGLGSKEVENELEKLEEENTLADVFCKDFDELPSIGSDSVFDDDIDDMSMVAAMDIWEERQKKGGNGYVDQGACEADGVNMAAKGNSASGKGKDKGKSFKKKHAEIL